MGNDICVARSVRTTTWRVSGLEPGHRYRWVLDESAGDGPRVESEIVGAGCETARMETFRERAKAGDFLAQITVQAVEARLGCPLTNY